MSSSNECIADFTTFQGIFGDVVPGTLAADQVTYPGQVEGAGCVYPRSAQTIGDQLDAMRYADERSGAIAGHLAEDLAQERTTPRFAFITPDLCNDGHDATCAGPNTEGNHTGGLVGADLWLKHWMPLLLGSPAYRDGHTLIVVTFDEPDPFHDATACCNEGPGPSWAWRGYASLLSLFGLPAPTQPGQYPGGGRVGAVLLNAKYIQAGSTNATPYNRYAALRSYEDLLGIDTGGADGHGHLGFAAQLGLRAFGGDVFNRLDPSTCAGAVPLCRERDRRHH